MNPMNPGGSPPGYPPNQPPPGYPPQPGVYGQQPGGYAPQPGAQPQGAWPQNPMPGAGGYAPGAPAVNRYGAAQSSLKNASGMLKTMQIVFAGLGALMALGGVVLIIAVDFSAGLGLLISGVVIGAVAWFTLPKFMGQLGGATAMVGALHAKEQLAMTGMPMTARVLGMQQTGALINMNPQVQATLEVQGPQGPYQVQTMAVIPQMNIPQFQPGMMVNVRVNPQDPRDVAVVF